MKLFTHFLFFLLVSVTSAAAFSAKIGVNYGTLGNNLPKPMKSVELIKTLKAKQVKLYSPVDPEILKALNGTNIQVSIMVPNEILSDISVNQTMANEWVRNNLVAYYPHTLIRYLLVGNELLSRTDDANKKVWHDLVPAMRKIQFALKSFGLLEVKVGTPMLMVGMPVPMLMDILESSSFPPSNGTFRSDIVVPVIKPLLQFLNKTKSFFFVDCYPYFAWSQSYKTVSLDYALFKSGVEYTDPVSGLTYTNMLDQLLDTLHFAMKKLGFPDIRIWIAETGWPNAGDIDQIGANVYNAATYNRNLVKKLNAKPAVGTPAMPGVALPTWIFSLYNENQKVTGTERHWGLLYPNGSNIYPIDLTGQTPESDYPPLPAPHNNEPYKGKIWCVLAKGANTTLLSDAITYACRQGNGTCAAIQPGGKCYYKANMLTLHASYAFSAYWAQFRSQGATCFFNGLAVQTTKNPSHGSCNFPSVTI
ncbi:hypothetical protein RND81_04G112700 [Saponaria officinalis]|uniref:glucan endo-1,3-beta-D-glucosidase n=1 Tax=Saponaria officinalis TaxID=3572 RepID=A0AAW1LK52_SAPOF